MEDLTNSLDTYKVQLTQVQAALTLDPENDELLKLQQDLEEVVQLTLDLISNETHDTTDAEQKTLKVETSVAASSSSNSNLTSSVDSQTHHDWKAGDTCLAFKEGDGNYHQAVVEDILPESETVAVTFVDSHTTEVCQVSLLKPFDTSANNLLKAKDTAQESDNNKAISKKELQIRRQEYRKKKNLKKKMKLKEKEAESEIKKNKWKDFNQKHFKNLPREKLKRAYLHHLKVLVVRLELAHVVLPIRK